MSVELKQFEDKMKKTVENLASDYTTIRAGRANPHILDKITVDYYGTPSNLQSVANISVSEARTLLIQPWEPSLIKEIEKAILVSDIGLTPKMMAKLYVCHFQSLQKKDVKNLLKMLRRRVKTAKLQLGIYAGTPMIWQRNSRKLMRFLRMSKKMQKQVYRR